MEIIDRDISWLHFNSRLLQEANNLKVPLLERIKFLGIYSNNLDEFYRVRIASINRLIEFNKKNYPDKVKDAELLLADINNYIEQRQLEFNSIKKSIFLEFESHHLFILDETQLNATQESFVKDYFTTNILPGLKIIKLSRNTSLQNINDNVIYLAVQLSKIDIAKKDYAIIEVPTNRCPRFIVLPDKGKRKSIIQLDDIIRFCLKDIFNIFGYDNYEAYTIKITRDSEIDLYGNVSKSFIDIVSESIKKRKSGVPVRFIYDKKMPDDMFDKLTSSLKIKHSDNLVKGGRYHNSKDYMNFPNLLGKRFEYSNFKKIPHRHLDEKRTLLSSISQQDVLLHYPFNSFNYIINLLRESSIDPKVKSIKITLYRLASDSRIISALLNAAHNGKMVTVFLELKARFEEEHNIYLTNILEEAGIKIIKTIPGIKVHCKLIHITTKENKDNVYYSVISTGNFNEKTANLYCDISLLTANQSIGIDVMKVFYLLESAYQIISFDHLIVSPMYTRSSFMKLIDNEIANAKKGKKASIDLKLNSLTDASFIQKLIEAAEVGVEIRISARASCGLVPSAASNVKAIGIVDRFLEHSRVFIFHNGGKKLYFIGSSDIMMRNLDTRIEVTAPIYDKKLQKELQKIMDIQFDDNVKAREWRSKENNKIVKNNKRQYITQIEIYKYLHNLNLVKK